MPPVGFVLGLTFKAIVDSVVNGILMPVIGYITAGIRLFIAQNRSGVKRQTGVEEVAISYGQVIQSLRDFHSRRLLPFLVVRVANKARRKKKMEEKSRDKWPS